jgi:hypothetical protein
MQFIWGEYMIRGKTGIKITVLLFFIILLISVVIQYAKGTTIAMEAKRY